jgi:hypothetical protein
MFAGAVVPIDSFSLPKEIAIEQYRAIIIVGRPLRPEKKNSYISDEQIVRLFRTNDVLDLHRTRTTEATTGSSFSGEPKEKRARIAC